MVMAEWLDMLAWFFGCIAQTLPREGLVWQIAFPVAREEVANVVSVAGWALVDEVGYHATVHFTGGVKCLYVYHRVLPYYIWAWHWVPLCIQSAHQCSVWFRHCSCWVLSVGLLCVGGCWPLVLWCLCCSGFNLSPTCVGCEVVPVVQCLTIECWCSSCEWTPLGVSAELR